MRAHRATRVATLSAGSIRATGSRMSEGGKRLKRSVEIDVPTVTFSHNDDTVVVIVGSGAGGGTLANELCQRDIDVVLLEAGPRFRVSDFVNDEWVMWDRFTWKD